MNRANEVRGVSPPRELSGPEREIVSLADEFLLGYDIATDIGRFRAFRDAIAFAQENLMDHPWCNLFLDRVGKSVGREPAYLDNLKARVTLPGTARLDFCYEEDWGFVLTGNTEGLDYLANVLQELRDAPCSLDHVHLPNDERPLGGRSYPVTIYKESGNWFDRLDSGEEGEDTFEDLPRRELEADQIYALQFIQFPPPELPLSINRIYRVRQVEAVGEDRVSEKSGEKNGDDIGPSNVRAFETQEARRFRFEFVGDTRRLVSLILHMDDPGVNFFSKKDLLKVVLDTAS